MGAFVMLFFVCTTVYMLFSLIRLFYADTLKPYKIRTLRALGKHRHHYRRRDSGSTISSDDDAPSLHSHASRWSQSAFSSKTGSEEPKRRKRNKHNEEDVKSLEYKDLPGDTISVASTVTSQPPERKKPKHSGQGETGGDDDAYPLLLGSLVGLTGQDMPELSSFPSKKEQLWGAQGKHRKSQIPIPVNREGHVWSWIPEWYQKKQQEEKTASEALDALKSAHSLLAQDSATMHKAPGEISASQSMPALTPSVRLPVGQNAGSRRIFMYDKLEKPSDKKIEPSTPDKYALTKSEMVSEQKLGGYPLTRTPTQQHPFDNYEPTQIETTPRQNFGQTEPAKGTVTSPKPVQNINYPEVLKPEQPTAKKHAQASAKKKGHELGRKQGQNFGKEQEPKENPAQEFGTEPELDNVPSLTPEGLLPAPPPSHADLLRRYTVRSEKLGSKLHTTISKTGKKTYQEQFAILRGAPRRKSKDRPKYNRQGRQSLESDSDEQERKQEQRVPPAQLHFKNEYAKYYSSKK